VRATQVGVEIGARWKRFRGWFDTVPAPQAASTEPDEAVTQVFAVPASEPSNRHEVGTLWMLHAQPGSGGRHWQPGIEHTALLDARELRSRL
jgi:hypothetical protein